MTKASKSVAVVKGSVKSIIDKAKRGVTRLLVFDHVTSQTALVLPVNEIAQEMKRLDIDVLVDVAHVPSMLPTRPACCL